MFVLVLDEAGFSVDFLEFSQLPESWDIVLINYVSCNVYESLLGSSSRGSGRNNGPTKEGEDVALSR